VARGDRHEIDGDWAGAGRLRLRFGGHKGIQQQRTQRGGVEPGQSAGKGTGPGRRRVQDTRTLRQDDRPALAGFGEFHLRLRALSGPLGGPKRLHPVPARRPAEAQLFALADPAPVTANEHLGSLVTCLRTSL